MRIAVMIKQVPDSKLIEIDENGNLRRDGVPAMIDPFGFYALRFGVRMKKVLGGTVTAITMGPNQAVEALRRCLEYGADDAVFVARAFVFEKQGLFAVDLLDGDRAGLGLRLLGAGDVRFPPGGQFAGLGGRGIHRFGGGRETADGGQREAEEQFFHGETPFG